MKFRNWFNLQESVSVVTETDLEHALILLSQGVEPSFKAKIPIYVYGPGKGIDRENLYVSHPTAWSKGGYGNIRLHLRLNQNQLQIPHELKQMGYTNNDLEFALKSTDGAVTKGNISPTAFEKVEIYDNGKWESMSPKEFMAKHGYLNTPKLPTAEEYKKAIQANAEKWFLNSEKIVDLTIQYSRAGLSDKIELAQEVGLI